MKHIQESNGFHQALLRAGPSLVAISFLTLLPFVSFSSSARRQETTPERVKVAYDEQKDLTQITLNPIILVSRKYEELRLGATTSYKGRVRVKPKEVALIFISLSASDVDKYESARKLKVVADGQQFALGETQRSKQAQQGLFIESMVAVVPSDIFFRICWAKEVRIKLGLTEVKLSTDQVTMLRAAASYMTQ